MAHIIGLVQAKSGAGRSTIATNLAGMFSSKYRTALIDCDVQQGTCASWFALRKADGRARNLTLATAADQLRLVREVDNLNRTHEVIVIDAPPGISKSTRATLILSQLCLVPLSGSAVEIWSISDLLKTIAQAKARKPGVDARIIWTRTRPVTEAAQKLSEEVSKELKLGQLSARIDYRDAYSEALAHGRTVMGWSDMEAREEMGALGVEIGGILRLKYLEARKRKATKPRK